MEPPSILQRLQKAVQCHQAGNLGEAERAYRDVLVADPVNVDATHLLGILAYQVGQDEQAVQLLGKVVAARPDLPGVHVNLAKALKRLGRLEEAAASYRRVLAIQPRDTTAHYNLGNTLKEMARFTEAAASYREALSINPTFLEAQVNLGMVLKRSGRLHDGIEAYHKALAIDPDVAECHYNLGLALNDLGKLDEAILSLRKALELKPDYADAHFGLGLTLLLNGNYPEGWREYEWRWQQEERAHLKRDFPQPQWNGTHLRDKTIFLYPEQGDGDSIQFIRHVRMVAERCGRVVVECQPSLETLFESVEGIDVLVAKGEEIPEFDVHASLLSLPHILGTTLETIPASVPYLRSPSDGGLEDTVVLDSRHRNIGIVWAGSPVHRKDRERSTQLEHFLELLSPLDIRLYSLQLGERRGDLEAIDPTRQILDLGGCLTDYSKTAAVIDKLDLVITVDTSVAHLAGAMGRPVWVLLPHAPDFRWMRGRSDSPWYPTMTLFRQQTIGDWESVFDQVRSALGRG